MDMNVELRHVMIGELYEQNWLLNKQVAGLQNDLVGARNALAEATAPKAVAPAAAKAPPFEQNFPLEGAA